MSSAPKKPADDSQDLFESIDRTMIEDDEPAVDPTRVQSHAKPADHDPEEEISEDEPAEHTPAQGNAFKWDSPSGVSHRVSAKNYYADDSVFGKLVNVFTMITLGAGLLVGGLCGYWLRGFFISVEPPAALSFNQEAVPMAPPPVETLPPALDSQPPANSETLTPPPAEEPAALAPVATPTVAAAKAEKPAAKKVAVKKQLRSVKLSAPAKNQVHADINTGGSNFKYAARLLQGPQRLVIDLNGITSTATKNVIAVPASAKNLVSGVNVEKRDADTLRVSFKLPKGQPKYSINRSKSGIKVIFRK